MFEVDAILFSPFVDDDDDDDARGIAGRRTRGNGIAVRMPSMRRRVRFGLVALLCCYKRKCFKELQMSTVFKRISRASSERSDVIVLFRRGVGLCDDVVVIVGFVEAEGG